MLALRTLLVLWTLATAPSDPRTAPPPAATRAPVAAWAAGDDAPGESVRRPDAQRQLASEREGAAGRSESTGATAGAATASDARRAARAPLGEGARCPVAWCDVVQCRRLAGVHLLDFATPPPRRA